MKKLRDLMHRGIIFCYPNDTAREVAKMMDSNQIRSVVVVDDNGEVWGLISVREMIPLYGKNLDRIKAEDIMKAYKIEVDPEWPIEKAIELMKEKRIGQLIIVDPHAGPKRPVGILTTFDVVQYMSGLAIGRHEQHLRMHEE